jgi:hypothetical protein
MATRGRKKNLTMHKIYEEKFRKYLAKKEKQIKKLKNES